MARPQVQLPGVAQAQPQAAPTGQFVQTKPQYQTPKSVLDLSRFSQTLTNLVAQSQQDAHERSMAQGEIDATYATPFGSSTPQTPEMEANRKAFKGAQEQGKILPSEDPWYRIGLYTGEGRRAALTMHNALLSDENLRDQSRVYDKNGDFIPFEQREDPNAMFERQAAVFLQTPALQSIYGKKAAAQMVEASRAEFVAQIAHRRDKQTQEYHETQLSDQTVEQLERVALASVDQSPEGRARFAESSEGLNDLIAEWTIKWNLPDGPKVARQGFLSYIDKAAVGDGQHPGSPEAAVHAIDLVRKVKLGSGGWTVSSDPSEDGVVFRARLRELESHYSYAASVEGERQEKTAKLYKEMYLTRVEDGISEMFALPGLAPAAGYEKLKARIEHEVEPRFQDEAKKILNAHYSDALDPLPKNPGADDELAHRLLVQTTDQISDWIRGIAGKEVSYGQAQEMGKKLQTESEAWKDLPEVKLAASAFKDDSKDFTADRSQGVQDDLNALTSDEIAGANQRIQLRASKLNGEQRAEQMGAIVKEEYRKATDTLDAFKVGIRTRANKFDADLLTASNKGVNFEQDIVRARNAGLLTRGEFNTAIERNQKASDLSHYTEDPRVQNIVPRLFPTAEAFDNAMLGQPWSKFENARLRAFEMAQEWAVKERGNYDSPRAADLAFTEFVNTKMRREVASSLDLEGADKPAGPSSKPGGPKQSQEDQATNGKQFQPILEAGDKGTLKLAAVKSYPIPNIKDGPQSLTKFQANFGQRNGLMPKVREQARNEMATLPRYDLGRQPEIKTALLNAGAAHAKELLDGAMVVNGVTIPIAPADVDPWKAIMFTSTRQFEAACAGDPETLYSLAAKYGVQEADFDAWVKQQDLLLKVNGL